MKSFLKWTGIGCGGFLVVLVAFLILGIVLSISDTSTTTTRNNLPPTPVPTLAPFATATPIPIVNLMPTASPTSPPTLEPTLTLTSMPTSTATPTATPTVTPTPSATPTPTLTPTPTVTPTPTPTPTPKPTPSPLSFELADLLREYETNKVFANTQYRFLENGGHPITVSGIVENIEGNYVSVRSDSDSSWIPDVAKCYYSDVREALHLKKGQKVTVTGRVRGEHYGDIEMYLCDIWEVHLDSNPPIQPHQVRQNVVQVFCIQEDSTLSQIFGANRYQGTGVVVNGKQGVVLTAHHIVEADNECSRVEIQLLGSKNRISATVYKHCASIDRAQLRVPPGELRYLPNQELYRAHAPAQVDQIAYFWGYGKGSLRVEGGIVESIWSDTVTMSAHAVEGDSGSPVFNESGHLLGILTRSNRSDQATFNGGLC